MVDEEVESTLREIRERIRAAADQPSGIAHDAAAGANSVAAANGEATTRTPEAIARIDAYLTTTARAWDRLPPLVSNRSGGLARLELWVKRRLKQATRWYAWEQINFNAAVHHALRDTLETLLDFEQQLEQLRAKLSAESEIRAQLFEQSRIELMSQRAEMEASQAQMEAEQRVGSLEVNARLADLARELRERDQQRLEEQRVCLKQLSLEMSEAEVLLDRARRDIESRLDKLERKRKS